MNVKPMKHGRGHALDVLLVKKNYSECTKTPESLLAYVSGAEKTEKR